ncbi:MAG TPA: TetR/AcrR family transcriptional regulator [Acidimicrobiales bacterium]
MADPVFEQVAEPVSVPTVEHPSSTRGRPRAAGRTDDILRAALELLEEVGYETLRMQDIADRAGAGLATIYRRWPTKQALIADALRYKAQTFNPPRCGDAVRDLVATFREFAEHSCGATGGEFLAGLVAALRCNPELASAFRGELIPEFRARLREYITAIVGPDVPEPQLELLVDLVPGVVLYRRTLRDVPVDPDELAADALGLIQSLCKRERR